VCFIGVTEICTTGPTRSHFLFANTVLHGFSNSTYLIYFQNNSLRSDFRVASIFVCLEMELGAPQKPRFLGQEK
jgi:hypothetical protein